MGNRRSEASLVEVSSTTIPEEGVEPSGGVMSLNRNVLYPTEMVTEDKYIVCSTYERCSVAHNGASYKER